MPERFSETPRAASEAGWSHAVQHRFVNELFAGAVPEAAETRSYAAAPSVLVVAEWLYLDWASRAPQPLPNNFVHAEWITLHDNPNFREFVDFLRTELDRVGPAHADLCRDFFSRAVALELSFFEAAYAT